MTPPHSRPDTAQILSRLRGLRSLVGNTPLLGIEFEWRGRRRKIYAKAENLNFTESVKDRMALHILTKAYERGTLQPGAMIVEATSGNTGIAFSAMGRALGHPVTIFMPDWMSSERVNLIRSLGASIHMVSRDQGGFVGSIALADELAERTEGAFLPRQFANDDNCGAHEATTGPEIYWQLHARGLAPDAFVAGVGTGGTVMGVGRFLRSKNPQVRVHPLEPSNSPTLSTGHCVGKHRIQGISDEFIPPICDLGYLDDIVSVPDGDAILMAQKLSRDLGLGVGISSGANVLGAIRVQDGLGDDAVVVTILADSNKKYLSTDLLRDEPVEDDYITPEIELLGFTAIKRVCSTCCDEAECAEIAASGGPLPACLSRADRIAERLEG